VKIPSRLHPLVLSGDWTLEGSPKPVHAVSLSSITLAPSKLTSLAVWSEEIGSMSIPSIEAVVREALQHDLGGLLDTALLDATAASSSRPAGLWNAATAVTASTEAVKSDAMFEDLAGLTAAVSSGAPDARVMFVANPAQALRLQMAGIGDVVVSGYQTAGSVGAVDVNGVAMMVGGVRFLASNQATVHLSDTPTALSVEGTPNTIAAPTTSLFQQDLIGLRSVLLTSWKVRRTGATALATSVTW